MKIEVYVKNQVYTINCATGSQKIRWLIEVASMKYDNNIMFTTGLPKGAKMEDGSQLNLNDRINERLQDNARIWAVFEDFSATTIVEKKK